MSTTVDAERRRAGLTLEELAFLSDTSYAHASRICRGLIELSPEKAEALARVFGVPAQALIDGQERRQAELRASLSARRELAEVAR